MNKPVMDHQYDDPGVVEPSPVEGASLETALCIALERWCEAKHLRMASADDLLADATDPAQREWLAGYVALWDLSITTHG